MNNSTPHTDRFEELCAAYVLYTLNAEEINEFELMLKDASPEEVETFYGLSSTANQLAFVAEPAEPSASVKERIMQQILAEAVDTEVTDIDSAPTANEEEKSRSNRFAMAMAASFALLLITLALVFYSFNLNSQISNKQSRIDRQQTQITELKDNVRRKQQMLSILGARTVDLVVMNGLDVNPNGYGKVIWDADHQRALLQVSNLPAVPSGKEYQLWLIKNNKPVSAGLFDVQTNSKNSFFKIEQMAPANEHEANAFAVTLEPKGGSPQPTGAMYLLGNLTKKAGS